MSRSDIKAHLARMRDQGSRTFSMEDLDSAPCTTRMSRQEVRHYLDELEWEHRIARRMGSHGPQWLFTSKGFSDE